jgi:hypothetical protein
VEVKQAVSQHQDDVILDELTCRAIIEHEEDVQEDRDILEEEETM